MEEKYGKLKFVLRFFYFLHTCFRRKINHKKDTNSANCCFSQCFWVISCFARSFYGFYKIVCYMARFLYLKLPTVYESFWHRPTDHKKRGRFYCLCIQRRRSVLSNGWWSWYFLSTGHLNRRGKRKHWRLFGKTTRTTDMTACFTLFALRQGGKLCSLPSTLACLTVT